MAGILFDSFENTKRIIMVAIAPILGISWVSVSRYVTEIRASENVNETKEHLPRAPEVLDTGRIYMYVKIF